MEIEKTGEDRIIHRDLSYAVIGAAFEVFNQLGWGLNEVVYQRALAQEFVDRHILFEKEVYTPLEYKKGKIARYYADFIVDGKILLELKVVQRLSYAHSKQVLRYLRSSGLKLGILIYFTRDGVKYRRIINSGV